MAIPCARCNMPLPGWELAAADLAACTSCGASNQVRVFPAAARAAAPVQTEAAIEGEATCFDHPGKRAVAACRHCGRFVCALCSVEFGEEVWCPSCVAGRAGGAQSANLETSRVLYDSIAVLTPWLSMFLWPLTIITGPGAVVFSILKWRQPLSLVRRSRWRFLFAILGGLVETAGWILVIGYLILRPRPGGT
jgi:hypothetical protein